MTNILRYVNHGFLPSPLQLCLRLDGRDWSNDLIAGVAFALVPLVALVEIRVPPGLAHAKRCLKEPHALIYIYIYRDTSALAFLPPFLGFFEVDLFMFEVALLLPFLH